jgi:hypothetical protein
LINLTMEQWIEIASKNGIAILVLVAMGWFIYKKIWPSFEKRLDTADLREKEILQKWEEQGKLFAEALKAEREEKARRFDEQGRMFMEALRTQNVLASETHKDSIKAQNKIVEKLEALDRRLRNGNGK